MPGLHLRKKYQRFVYHGYAFKKSENNLKVSFDFEIEPGITFKPILIIRNVNPKRLALIGDRVLANLVFHLGLIEMLSYWKATCCREIAIKAGYLNPEQIKWWKTLILKGMGQFFYENRINFQESRFINIKTHNKPGVPPAVYKKALNRQVPLIAAGGGKDSAVTLEILKKAGINTACFSLNPRKPSRRIASAARCAPFIIATRKIDKKLLELNRRGYLNGHTPFSAYLAFLGVLLGVIFNRKYIVFSNERSSEEGNVKYLGKMINHQWSKTLEFENMFRKYSKKFLAKDIEYFSFLRPLNELQIAAIFAGLPDYFSRFLSCNKAFASEPNRKKMTGKWCGRCAKCLFVFAILYPFLNRNQIFKIFQENLFAKKELVPLMQELIGLRKFKPFECVGTTQESLVAFYLDWKKTKKAGDEMPLLLKYFEKKVLPGHPGLEKESKKIMVLRNQRHYLPQKFAALLKQYQKS